MFYPNRRRYPRIALITLFVLAVLGAMGEIGGRLYIWVKYGVPGKTYGIHRHDEELGGILRPNSYNTIKEFNNLAFQSSFDTVLEKPPGIFRAVAYGGSTTMCFNLPTGQCWPHLLERRIRAMGMTGAEILNAGDAAWSLAHAFARARRELTRLTLDFVIIYSGLNEVINARGLKKEGLDLAQINKDGRVGLFTRELGQSRSLLRNSVIFRIWFYNIYRPYILRIIHVFGNFFNKKITKQTIPDEPNPQILQHYLKTLEAFLTFVHESGARSIFIIQAVDPTKPYALHRARYSRIGSEIARDLGAIVVDGQNFAPAPPGEVAELFIETGIHLNKVGARKLADYLAEAIDWQNLAWDLR